jgi:hypothetical protein
MLSFSLFYLRFLSEFERACDRRKDFLNSFLADPSLFAFLAAFHNSQLALVFFCDLIQARLIERDDLERQFLFKNGPAKEELKSVARRVVDRRVLHLIKMC